MTTNCNTQLSVNVMCGNQIPREAIYITIVPHNIYTHHTAYWYHCYIYMLARSIAHIINYMYSHTLCK